MNPSSDELKWLAASWGNVQVHGQPSLLFGVRSTSAVEGDNNDLLWGRKKHVARLNVVASTVHNFFVFDAFSYRNAGDCVQVYEVNLERKLCTRCVTFEQF
ncbi:Hypothetical protein PHPALM_7632 [Phytophthora palmivora]|uniref:Uncharacterized protein n=1 Tax=Phytophthora palmivora TaxID=4796 RepID=A0A2P4YBU1_9STRA|nr:Hypothetical protein PHPALM_7632 [Phytophthora palmivora]